MPTWKDNAAMWWHDGTTFRKITDHNRSPLNVNIERIENKQRMVNGRLRRYTVTKKRTWDVSWDMLPSKNGVAGSLSTADGGWAGEDIETFHNTHNDEFQMQLRRGNGQIETVTVMIADFSKEVPKRGPGIDLWNLTISLEEV